MLQHDREVARASGKDRAIEIPSSGAGAVSQQSSVFGREEDRGEHAEVGRRPRRLSLTPNDALRAIEATLQPMLKAIELDLSPNKASRLPKSDKLGQLPGAQRRQRRDPVQSLERVGLAVPVPAFEDVEAFVKVEDLIFEISKTTRLQATQDHARLIRAASA